MVAETSLLDLLLEVFEDSELPQAATPRASAAQLASATVLFLITDSPLAGWSDVADARPRALPRVVSRRAPLPGERTARGDASDARAGAWWGAERQSLHLPAGSM